MPSQVLVQELVTGRVRSKKASVWIDRPDLHRVFSRFNEQFTAANVQSTLASSMTYGTFRVLRVGHSIETTLRHPMPVNKPKKAPATCLVVLVKMAAGWKLMYYGKPPFKTLLEHPTSGLKQGVASQTFQRLISLDLITRGTPGTPRQYHVTLRGQDQLALVNGN